MILVIDTNLKEVKFWVFKKNETGILLSSFVKDAEEIRTSKTLQKDIFSLAGRGKITAIAFRILFGGEFFDKATVINQEFFAKFVKMTDLFPFYIPLMLDMLKIFYRDFQNIPQIAFFETSFFSRLPEEEKYYAIPQEFHKNNKIKKWGFHGIFHEANSGMFSQSGKNISVVFDKQTTVCSVKDNMPLSISLGFTPLEGIMSRTSCGDLDPGIVFYLMNVHKFSIYKIDDILKNESGFLGLTGYDLEIRELVKFYGKDPKVNLAFDVYQAQLLKYIGEGISVLGGLDNIVFSGSQVDALIPIIHSLIKKISFLGINTKSLPWSDKKEIFQVTSRESGVKVYLNLMNLPKVIFYETVKFLQKNFPKA
jgi:acetate kinase